MGVIHEVLFGKVDLDTIATSLVLGLVPGKQKFRQVRGSAKSADLSDSGKVCIEVGGDGRTSENNFDHHSSTPLAGGVTKLSAAAQAMRRLANVIDYVDQIDRGLLKREPVGFPSLVQLVSGMLLSVRDPEEQIARGQEIFWVVIQAGLDPFTESMEPILDAVPNAREWAEAKLAHEAKSADVLGQVRWLETTNGLKVGVVESDWFGTPGLLYGSGADVVISMNPAMPSGGKTLRKATVAVSRGSNVRLDAVLEQLRRLEDGWGGPNHMTILGSPRDKDTSLSLDQIANIVIETL